MKPQDIIFIIILLALLYKKKPNFFVIAALSCLVLSMPFFQFWVFFTAERLVLYGFVFLLIAVIMLLIKRK